MHQQIDILLATYQGEAFLEEQLHSIFNQTYPSFHLWVRDDHSTDQTNDLLSKWAQKYPNQLTLVASKKKLGAKGNFAELMKQSLSPYVMFADQDDKWNLDKVELSFLQMKELEKVYGKLTPLLIHTDLAVVNSSLSPLAPSFLAYSGLNAQATSLSRLLMQNVLTGCTFLMNRSLVNLALPLANEALMHDWWIGLVACCFGKIGFVNKATLLYRQHQKNDTGAYPYRLSTYFTHPSRFSKQRVKALFEQAKSFLNHYQDRLTLDQETLLKNFIQLNDLSFFKQRKAILKNCFFKQGFFRNLKHLFTKL